MMKFTLLQSLSIFTISIIVFLLIALFYVLGHFIHQKRIKFDAALAKVDISPVNGTILALLGLLLAFTFSMSSNRYDTRRKIIIEEANDIGTAILRADLYPDSIRNPLKIIFKEYVDARILYYTTSINVDSILKYYNKADNSGKQLWKIVADDVKTNNSSIRSMQMIPALNAMIDITTTRKSESESTVPDSIMYFLFALCFCSAFLLGYGNRQEIDWVVVFGFALMLSVTIYTIMDLDRSRRGLINMDRQNEKMIELRSLFIEK